MIINAIEGSTRVLGKAQGYRGLWIRDEILPHGPQMVSSWQLTNAELARIQDGAPVLLTILGSAHPPVLLEVGDPPSPAQTDLTLIEDLLDRLDYGVPVIRDLDGNDTDLFDVGGASATMAEAARALRDLISEFSGDPDARRADREALIDRWLKPVAKPTAPAPVATIEDGEFLPACPFCGNHPVEFTPPDDIFPDGFVACSTIRENGKRCGDFSYTLTGWKIRATPAQASIADLDENQIDRALDAMESNMRAEGLSPLAWRSQITPENVAKLRACVRAGIVAAIANPASADEAYRASLPPDERAQLDFSLAIRNGAKVALPKDKTE